MPRILCLETATTVCSVALISEKIISSREINAGFSHAEKLTVFISECVEEGGIKPEELDAIAVSSGPGSYTGLRIGISVSKGLCLSLDKPLISIPTLDSMASGVISSAKKKNKEGLFCPMIDARRMEVYCALYDSDMNVIHPASAMIISDEFFRNINQQIYFFGDGAEKCRTILKDKFIFLENEFPSAKKMLSLANQKYFGNVFEDVSLFEPFYLKSFVPGKR